MKQNHTENVQAISKQLERDVSEEESSEQLRNLVNFMLIMLAIWERENK
jgi:hypothetical protein